MKNLYFSVPLMAIALTAGSSVFAQTAKPRAAKATARHQTMVPAGTHQGPAVENRGGANDECASAIPVTVTAECAGSLATYDASAATESLPGILCNGYTSPAANDLWFSYVATSSVTNITVEGTASFDPVLEGFSGDCGSLVSTGCADATFPTAGENTFETLVMATTVGSTYYVRVYSYSSPEPVDFTFTLCVFQAGDAPANDLCTSAAPAILNQGASVAFTGDNTGALDTEGLGFGSVWHAFTISEYSNLTLDYCGTDPAFGNALLTLFIGCPATGGVGASSFDQTTCPDGNVTMFFENVCPGTYYYAVILDEVNGAVGPYTVNVSAAATPAGYCVASSDECDEYIAQVTVGTINNATECVAGEAVDYTAQSMDMIQSEVFPITVLNGPSIYDVDAVTAWVDWNQNENFCEANEAYPLISEDGGQTFTGNIVAPVDAIPGNTRMRIRMAYDEVPSPCGGSAYGEVEDYTVNVILGNSINEVNSLDWAVFPNPSNGDMTIRYGAADAKVVIELFDVTGRAVHQEQRQLFNGQQVSLGLAGTLANGAYTLRLSSPEGRSEQRVVVQ